MEWINFESNQEVHLRGLMCKEPIKSNDDWEKSLNTRWVYLANEEVQEPKLNQNSML